MSSTSLTKKSYRDPASRTDRLRVDAESEFRNAFLSMVAFLRDRNDLTRVSDLLSQGRVDSSLREVERGGRRLGSIWASVFSNAAVDTAVLFDNKTGSVIDFDRTAITAVRWMQMNQLRLIRLFSQEQVQASRVAVIRGIERGLNSSEQALFLTASLGLTTRQVESYVHYRDLLESLSTEALQRDLKDPELSQTLRSAIRDNEPLTRTQITDMTRRYHERQLNFRANNIGRTEALSAVNSGVYEMYGQGIAAGVIDGDSVTRKWNTRRNSNVRDLHKKMQGQRRGFFDVFQSGLGGRLRFPGDMDASVAEVANCQCYLSIEFSTS